MRRIHIILSAAALFFLLNSMAMATESSGARDANKFDTVLTAASSFSSMLEEKEYANHLFIFKLNAIVQKHRDLCPQNVYLLAADLKTLSDEIHASQKLLKELYPKFDSLQSQLQNIQKKKTTPKTEKQIEQLLTEIAAINKRIFENEGMANQLYPPMLSYYEAIYAGLADKGCPEGMVFIDASYCVDQYEYPNKKGSEPAMGASYEQAAALCGAAGKRLCSGQEWSRACDGAECKRTIDTLRPFSASECNIITESGEMIRPPSPSGDNPICDTPEGVSDMLANAWEWTSQDYKNNFKIVQGGAQKHDRSAVCSSREWAAKSDARHYYGFRCCSSTVSISEVKKTETATATTSWSLTSPAFAAGALIPERYTCDSANISPALSWTPPPAGAKELLLIMDDPDAPRGTWTHWTVYKLSPETKGLPESLPADATLTSPASATQGQNSSGKTGYAGPCPPSGKHRYFFKLYALNEPVELLESADISAVRSAIEGKVILETELMGVYSKR